MTVPQPNADENLTDAPSRASARTPSNVDSHFKRIARGLGRRLVNFGAVAPEGFDLGAVASAEIALYFSDYPAKLYQLKQWLPVFENNPDRQSMVVLRQVESYKELVGKTSLPLVLAPTFEDLMALYDRAGFHAVVYVNNGWTNFQSLAFQQAVHVHVNHGESDKICMVSNQAKAYDRVFVAGEAAVHRHAAAIAWFDLKHLVRVGRPQLDLKVPCPLPPTERRTITYAPTWEGEDDANNYTSIDCYGVGIVEAALSQKGVRVAYKPHPRVASSEQVAVRQAHAHVVQAIQQAAEADPAAGHCALLKADILGLIRGTDLMISDVSSVTLDHLYLRPEAPILLTDRRSDRAQLLHDAPIAEVVSVIDSSTSDALPELIASTLEVDPRQAERARMRAHYFGDVAPGQSTQRFWEAIDAAIAEHDQAMQALSRVRVGASPKEVS